MGDIREEIDEIMVTVTMSRSRCRLGRSPSQMM